VQGGGRAGRGTASGGGGEGGAHSFVSVVGRELELSAITQAIGASEGGAITCCVLEGEAGMGKSTLVPLLR
jgi:AAA ATPase domain